MISLLRSMRFAVAVLVVVAVAATIGSILEQNQPAVVYVSRFGAYWSALFTVAGLTDVYHAWWFFVLLGFMAASTTLCLWQRTPAMLRAMRGHRLEKSRASLARTPHRAEWDAAPGQTTRGTLQAALKDSGFSVRSRAEGAGWIIGGRRGSGRRAGYLLVHAAMVLICVGGLADGNVGLRWRLWRGEIQPARLDVPPDRLPAAARLDPGTGSFRAAVKVAEGSRADTAEIAMGDRYLLQRLPFGMQLDRFEVAHHPNGLPRDFVSTLRIVDGTRTLPVTLRVNHPVTFRGVTLFQSGFDDGGSELDLRLRSLTGAPDQRLHTRVGDAAPLLADGQPYTIEATELHTVNVMARDAGFPASWSRQRDPGARSVDAGPSLQLRLRNAQGQAEEWQVWQRPLTLEGEAWVVLGRRRPEDAQMRYLRLPADSDGRADAFLAWSAALNTPAARARAAAELARAVPDAALAANLRTGAERLLERFSKGGLDAVGALVPANLDANRRAAGAKLYLDLLERAAALLEPRVQGRMIRSALLSYSEIHAAGVPTLIQLDGYRQVQAAVIQVTKAPGAKLVYLGCAMLALGVVCMYFVRERRVWLHCDGRTLLLALDANRPGPQLDTELSELRSLVDHTLHSQVTHV
jgi:cytochrome c biogenesis protein